VLGWYAVQIGNVLVAAVQANRFAV